MIHTLSALQMKEALDEGDLSSVDIVHALLARRDAVDPHVRAFVHRFDEAALARAAAMDTARRSGPVGPLHGLPISVKENFATVGVPQSIGVEARLARLARGDAALVATALDAGAIVLGKTNLPQLMLSMETDNDLYGTTWNPWDLTRVPGGSSGGEGAAIASGQSPLGLGTDIGGSIRIPAAWCGIVGLKPTAGRWSLKGAAAGLPGQEALRSVAGPLARTVADVELLMLALDGPAQHRHDPAVPPLAWSRCAGVEGLTIGVFEDDGVISPAASVCRAIREAAEALRAAGATVVPYCPPAGEAMFDVYFGLASADGARTARRTLQGERVTQQLSALMRMASMPGPMRRALATAAGLAGQPRVARLLRALGEKRVDQHWALVRQREELKAAEEAAWREAGLDLVLGPATMTPPALPRRTHDWSIGAWATMRYNVLDRPAGVVPVTHVRPGETVRTVLEDRIDTRAAEFEAGSVGLPIAVQVAGRPWEEHLVMAALRAIEAGAADRPITPVDPTPVR